MSISTNRLQELGKQDEPAYGLWLMLPGMHHARHAVLASPACSWVLIDCEHGIIPLMGPGGAGDCIAGISTSSDNPPAPIVRIPAMGHTTSASWQIGLVLDAGAKGVMVPMVNSKAQAEMAVKWSKFPPIGTRGFGNPITQELWQAKNDLGSYLLQANDKITVFVQIESPEAVSNVEEIASVPGIDYLFIGPSDLSLSHGFSPPSPEPHPEVEKLIQRILKAAKDAGKKVAMYCPSGAIAKKRTAMGFNAVSVQNDITAISANLAKEFNDALNS